MFSLKKEKSVKLFEQKEIRTHWDNEAEKWYFSITDACAVLANSKDRRNYWKALKNCLKKEDSQLVTNCNQLKMIAKGKSNRSEPTHERP